jgi:hypothetical protein
VFNNTIIGGGVSIPYNCSKVLNSNIYNNIMMSGGIQYDTLSVVYSDYNCYSSISDNTLSAWVSTMYRDSNSINDNPSFIVGSGYDPNNYKLQVGSPCIGTGRLGENIGAYSYGNETVGLLGVPPVQVDKKFLMIIRR